MKLKSTALRAAAASVVGGLVLGATGTAFAAAPATGTGGFEPDTVNQLGQIVFYDTAGNVQTSGDPTVNGWFGYAVATTDDPVSTNTGASLFGYAANSATNIGAWSGKQTSTATQFPVTAAGTPSNIAGTRTHQPVVAGAQSVVSIASLATSYPNSTDAKYPNIYQFRIKTPSNTQWWAADIQYTPATSTSPARWTQLYPDITATTTNLTASPASPAVAGSNVTLTATLTNSAPGSVTFTDTSVSPARTVGTATLPASATNNSVSVTDTAPATGSHSYVATYTQAVGTPYANSASQPLAYSVIPPADSTSTTNAASPTPQYTGTTFTLSSTVTDTQATPNANPANPAGTVTWTDTFTPSGATAANAPTTIGTATLAPTSGSTTASNASYTVTGGLSGVGSHSIVASFTPNPSTKWSSSSSPAVAFTLAAQPCPPNTCDQQAFQVTVDPGTLTISTPYTTASPFNLGHMALDPKGTILRASAPFGTGTDGKGVTITDTRAGQLGWTASVTTTDFTGATKSSNVINGQNLSFTGVAPQYVTGNALQAGSVTPTDVTTAADSTTMPSAYGTTATGSDGLKGGPHQFAKAAAGNSVGTVYMTGTMKIVAPTSTSADTYNGTVTFTIA